MKTPPDTPEFNRFSDALKEILTVPKKVIQERIEEYEAQAQQNPRKRGPKPKRDKDNGES